MADDRHDRTTQDVGNIVALEHVNVKIPDQQVATLFYVVGLGLTRDPYLMVGLDNMWINIGQQQFHLPTGTPQVLRGDVGLVIPDFDELPRRLAMVERHLGATKFGYTVEDKHVRVVSPWGNVIRCHPPGPAFGEMTLGMPYVEFPVERGAAEGIARFYREGLGAPAVVARNGGGAAARVTVGSHQELIFRETAEALPPYDGHHVADLHHGLLGTAPLALRARARHRGEQLVPVPLPGHRRARQRPGALHHRARGAEPPQPALPSPAGQPQPRPAAAHLPARPGCVRPGDELVGPTPRPATTLRPASGAASRQPASAAVDQKPYSRAGFVDQDLLADRRIGRPHRKLVEQPAVVDRPGAASRRSAFRRAACAHPGAASPCPRRCDRGSRRSARGRAARHHRSRARATRRDRRRRS